jgi:hypothetical protein
MLDFTFNMLILEPSGPHQQALSPQWSGTSKCHLSCLLHLCILQLYLFWVSVIEVLCTFKCPAPMWGTCTIKGHCRVIGGLVVFAAVGCLCPAAQRPCSILQTRGLISASKCDVMSRELAALCLISCSVGGVLSFVHASLME